jgi:hypothetical protein
VSKPWGLGHEGPQGVSQPWPDAACRGQFRPWTSPLLHGMNGQRRCRMVSCGPWRAVPPQDGLRTNPEVAVDGGNWGQAMVRIFGKSATTRKSWAWLACGGLVCCVAACSTAPPQARPVTHAQGVPSGYTEFRDAGSGYSVAVPSSWTQINVQSPDAAAAFAKLVKLVPKIGSVYGNNVASLAQRKMSLLAVSRNNETANMIVTQGNGTASAAELTTLWSTVLQPSYSRVGFIVESHQLVVLDRYPALRIQITFAIRGRSVPETQFILGAHGEVYALTIANTSAATTNEIAGTLRLQ